MMLAIGRLILAGQCPLRAERYIFRQLEVRLLEENAETCAYPANMDESIDKESSTSTKLLSTSAPPCPAHAIGLPPPKIIESINA